MAIGYTLPHAAATAIGIAAVSYQSAVVWEALDNVSLITKLGIPLATVAAALLPVIAEAAAHQRERFKAALLVVPVLALIAFVVPSGVSRLGEAAEAKRAAAVASQGDAVKLRADLAKADKLVSEAEAWAAVECKTGKGPKCDGATFILNQRAAFQRELSAKVRALQPVASPWLPTWHPATLPIGLELAVWACCFYGLGPLARRASPAVLPAVCVGGQLKAITERDFSADPLTDAELEELRKIVGNGVNNKTLAEKLSVSEGQASKLVTQAVACGKVSRTKVGREVRISALH